MHGSLSLELQKYGNYTDPYRRTFKSALDIVVQVLQRNNHFTDHNLELRIFGAARRFVAPSVSVILLPFISQCRV